MSIRTTEIPGNFALSKNTKRVDKITDVSGAAAEIQKSFGFLMLCVNSCTIEHIRTILL